MDRREAWQCQNCGAPIGYVGRALQWLRAGVHECPRADLGSCPLCHTALLDGGGIGPFCPNALCHVSDAANLYDRLAEPRQHTSRACPRLNAFRPKPCDCGAFAQTAEG